MAKLQIERIGGYAGFGNKNSHVRSYGEIDMMQLSEEERRVIESLFTSSAKTEANSIDAFRYRISRVTSSGTEKIEVGEDEIPNTLLQYLKDEFI
jgi:hypothetical protein